MGRRGNAAGQGEGGAYYTTKRMKWMKKELEVRRVALDDAMLPWVESA